MDFSRARRQKPAAVSLHAVVAKAAANFQPKWHDQTVSLVQIFRPVSPPDERAMSYFQPQSGR